MINLLTAIALIITAKFLHKKGKIWITLLVRKLKSMRVTTKNTKDIKEEEEG